MKRNFLIPGDFVSPIPVGVRLTLQYDALGHLEKIYKGINTTLEDITEKFILSFLQSRTAPECIQISKGTTWVKGVLYTAELLAIPGHLPECVEDALLDKYLDNPGQFNFFAGTMSGTATNFIGATPIRQALTIAKFKLLPGWLVPHNIDDNVLYQYLHKDSFPFNPDMVSDYMVYRKEDVFMYNIGLHQHIVTKVRKSVDINGYIQGNVSTTDSPTLVFDYSDIVTHNIQANSLIVIDSSCQIVYTHSVDNKKRENRSSTLTCTYCGKPFTVPASGCVQCSDPHCTSKLLPKLKQFMSVLKITTLTDNELHSLIEKKQLTCVPDLLTLEQFKDAEIIVTLAQILRSLVPVSVIPSDEVLVLFANACNNNKKTFIYYINHPDSIGAELNICHPYLRQLRAWLCDGCNVSDLDTILNSFQIQLTNLERKFDGAPIFRNKKIYITGSFIHGTLTDIISILNSYSAVVATTFDRDVSFVVTGDARENIDGKALASAKILNIPIVTEGQFFDHFGIDDDLKANLVYNQ